MHWIVSRNNKVKKGSDMMENDHEDQVVIISVDTMMTTPFLFFREGGIHDYEELTVVTRYRLVGSTCCSYLAISIILRLLLFLERKTTHKSWPYK